MNFSDIPNYSVRPASASPAPRDWSHLPPSTRRSFIKGTIAAGVGFGLATVALLPPARRAFATHGDGYEIKQLPCTSSHETDNCHPGCAPSTVYANACIEDSTNHNYEHHKANGCTWTLRKDQCMSGTTYDGWKWFFGDANCGCCSEITYRCHDGWNCDSNCANCSKSVCRWVTACTLIPNCV